MSEEGMSTGQRLVYMANQIARNLGYHGKDAAAATADHLIQFWDPRMKQRIIALADETESGLSDAARRAVTILAVHDHADGKAGLPTDSAIDPLGGSDAG
jgi:formate dehydrogenase subunit delta